MGKTTHAKVVIIGSGPAGYTAAIYAARAMLEPILIQGIQPGGQLTITTDVENYPGFADVIQGPWLMEQMQKQAEHVGTKIVTDHVSKVDLSRRPFRLECDSGDRYLADSVIIATGAQARWLGLAVRAEIQGLRRLGLRHLRRLLLSRQGRAGDRRRQYRGRGGAVPHQLRLQGDGGASARQFPRGEDPAGPAVQESEDLGDLGHACWTTCVGSENPLKVQGRRSAQRQDRRAQRAARPTACSSPSATRPASELFAGQVEMKPSGYIKTAPYSTATSVPGVFAAGDVTDDVYRQAVTAAGQGCMAALEAGTLPRRAAARRSRRSRRNDASPDARMSMDWDKLKVFHAAAEAGSFTHAGEQLGLSQSAVSRQVSALEQELGVSLFHRHARGLILTEQGELLHHTAHDVFMKLEAARAKLTDSRERPNGELKVHDHARHRRALADAAARRVHRPLSRHPHHADHHRRGTRSRDARGRRGDPAAPADAARPDPAQAVLGAVPRLCLAGIPQALRHAARRSMISTITASCCSAARSCPIISRTGAG